MPGGELRQWGIGWNGWNCRTARRESGRSPEYHSGNSAGGYSSGGGCGGYDSYESDGDNGDYNGQY